MSATVPLATLVRVAGTRWSIEEPFQAAKGQVGLDAHQVRQWICWQRFTVLALAVLAVLAAELGGLRIAWRSSSRSRRTPAGVVGRQARG